MAVNTAGDATAYANNDAYYDSSAGDDSIVAGDDGDVISGGSQARATDGDAKADTDNRALSSDASAGNDFIQAGEGANLVAGEAQAISSGGDAQATGTHQALPSGAAAGNDATTRRGAGRERGGRDV